MTTDVRYARLIPMVQAVLVTLDEGIVADEARAAELASLAHALADAESVRASSLLRASRQISVRVLEIQGRRAALLALYGFGS